MEKDDIFEDVQEGASAPAQTTKPLAEDKAELLLEKLFEKGTIVKLSIGCPKFQRKLTPKDLEQIGIDPAELPQKIISLGQKRLIKKESLESIRSIEGKARDLVTTYSSESWIPGLRYMTNTAAASVAEKLAELKKEFLAEAEKFLAEYPKIREAMLQEFGKWRKILEPYYPDAGKLQKAFYFDVSQFEVTLAKKAAQVLEGEKLKLKENLAQKLDSFLKETVQDTRIQFIEELNKVLDKIKGDETVNAKTVKKIHDMIEVAKAKNFVDDAAFLKQLDEFKESFTKEATKDKDLKQVVQAKLKKVIEVAKDEKTATDAVESYKRSILV